MKLANLNEASYSTDWDAKWADIFDHYQQDLRHAYYIHSVLDEDDKKILEIGAGSFRDMAELRNRGLNCEGMDFSVESVARARERFPMYAQSIHHMSAFNFTFPDKSFDVSYHNGFWVLFDDQSIMKLIREQVRVTKSKIIVTVHNAHNEQFVNYFESLKKNDSLYDIRFFKMNEIVDLMLQLCKEVQVIPVGKGKKFYEDALIASGITDPKAIRELFEENQLRHLEISERLMCIGVLS